MFTQFIVMFWKISQKSKLKNLNKHIGVNKIIRIFCGCV